MAHYRVPLKNDPSSTTGIAQVESIGPAPTVLGLEIGEDTSAAGANLRVTVRFDPTTLSGPGRRFGYEVRVVGDGGVGIVADGDDDMREMADIDANYAITGDGDSYYWRKVTRAEVFVMVELK